MWWHCPLNSYNCSGWDSLLSYSIFLLACGNRTVLSASTRPYGMSLAVMYYEAGAIWASEWSHSFHRGIALCLTAFPRPFTFPPWFFTALQLQLSTPLPGGLLMVQVYLGTVSFSIYMYTLGFPMHPPSSLYQLPFPTNDSVWIQTGKKKSFSITGAVT